MTTTHNEVDIETRRRRLGTISRAVDTAALLDAMRAAMPDVEDSQLYFADLSDDAVVALLERFDRPGFVVQRTAPTEYQPETASVGVILPSGETVTITAYGVDTSKYSSRLVPTVSWPSIGEVSPADAAAFAAAMGVAAGVASMLSSQIGGDK